MVHQFHCLCIDLRALEDAVQPYLPDKTDAVITQKIVMDLIESNEQLKTQFESLRGRAEQVAYLPVVSKLEQVMCDVLKVKNSKTLEGLFSNALINDNYVLAETILEQLPVEEKAAWVAKQLTAGGNWGKTLFSARAIASGNLDRAKWLLKVSKGKKDADGTDLVAKQLTAVDAWGRTHFEVVLAGV